MDPFRYWHNAEENDPTAMSGVMQPCRALARYGCAVILLHHPAKSEGSTGRGSSAIRGGGDLAFLHSLDKDNGLITLKVDKNRNGESRTITIKADFEGGQFTVAGAPYIAKRKDELAMLEQLIRAHPGISQNSIVDRSGISSSRIKAVLDEGRDTLWHSVSGPRKSKLYYAGPESTDSLVRTDSDALRASGKHAKSIVSKSNGSAEGSGGELVPLVLRLIDETSEPVTDPTATTLPSCKNCGSFYLYRDGTCMTCE